MDPQETKDENAIRHYKGSVAQFKQMFDDLADGKNTNAYDTPEYQGYDGVHPVRGEIKSPHWEETMKTTSHYLRILNKLKKTTQ